MMDDMKINQDMGGSESIPAIGDGRWEVIVKYNGDILSVGAALGADVEILSERYAIVTAEPSVIERLNTYSEVEHIEVPKRLASVLQNSTVRSCVPPVWNGAYQLTGAGVLIAVIDSGIDYTHPDFRNADGTSRILSLWDQSEQGGMPPDGFKKGAAYSKADLDAALAAEDPFSIVPQNDLVGHGTAVAGTAAGNGRASAGRNKGVAPEAALIIVKLAPQTKQSYTRATDLMRGVKYVMDQAIEAKMPLVINISYGTNHGAHDGQSLLETYLDDMSNRWKTSIVAASGNEGVAGHHFMGNLATGGTIDVDFYSDRGLKNFFITMWKNFVDNMTVELIMPNGRTTGEIVYSVREKTVTLNDITVIVQYGQPSHYQDDQEIFFELIFNERANSEGLWKIRIKGVKVVDGRFHIWLPVSELVTTNTAFSKPAYETTLTLPSTANRVVTVGAYNAINNSIADFSGRGYTRNNVYVKPELAAPGVHILAPKSGGGYDGFSGTSIAAPFVAGAGALLMQWGIVQGFDPMLYGQRLKAFLKIGATREAGKVYPNPEWGYGALCVSESLSKLLDYV